MDGPPESLTVYEARIYREIIAQQSQLIDRLAEENRELARCVITLLRQREAAPAPATPAE